MSVTAVQLKTIFPSAKAAIIAAIVADWPIAIQHGINNLNRTQDFLAMIGVESGGLRAVEENLNYTTAAQIKKTWPTRFKTIAAAQVFVRKPRDLANKVYNGRMGNARTGDDGWNYRGGGIMQTTGKDGYANMAARTGLDLVAHPELLRDPKTAFLVACIEWEKRSCNALSDRGDVNGMREAVNGGLIGLDEFKKYRQNARQVISLYSGETIGFAGSVDVTSSAAGKTGPVVIPMSKPTPITPDTIRNVQQMLRDRGYPEVGEVDGKMGDKTETAILAFRKNANLPLVTTIDAELMAALVQSGHREIAPARATATKKDLKDAPAIKQASLLQNVGIGGVATSVIGGVINGSIDLDSISANVGKAQAFMSVLSTISPWIIGAAVGGIAIYIASSLIRKQVVAYREGRHV